MTKTELMETYTAEQLAEMVVELQNEKESKVFKVPYNKKLSKEFEKFLKESPIQRTIDRICKDITDQKNNAMAMEFTRVICELLRENGIYVHCTEAKFSEKITENTIEERYGIKFDSMDFSEHDKEFTDEIEKLKEELRRSQTTITQIDEILSKLFSVTHDIAKQNEFREILKNKVRENISDFLPTEPIKVAEMLINATYTREKGNIEKAFYKAFGNNSDMVEENVFDISELRQIAEHLLVYCNHNGEVEE